MGLLIYTKLFKLGNENVHFLFATDGSGRDGFRCSMSKKRFENLVKAFRFDDFSHREERKKYLPATEISGLLRTFTESSQRNFSVDVFVDETLLEAGVMSKCICLKPNNRTNMA